MDLAYIHGKPELQGSIRNANQDFQVEEVLGFELDGQGEHIWYWIEKEGQTTNAVIKEFARKTGVQAKKIGYSGMKDKYAITRQWICLPWPIKKADPILSLETCKILRCGRHSKKLKIGTHKKNKFKIKIQLNSGDLNSVESRLTSIANLGVANYFGEQRFGRDGDNVDSAIKMFTGEKKVFDRKLRGMFLSAARSEIFNQVLNKRIERNLFEPTLGDAFMLSGSNSFFVAEEIDDAIIQRFNSGDILLSGLMFGEGESITQGKILQLEQEVIEANKVIADGLVEAGLKQDRRALQLPVEDLSWELIDKQDNQALVLSFVLSAGSFATSVLREVVQYQDVTRKPS